MAIFTFISAKNERLVLTNAENFALVNIDAQTQAQTDISSLTIGGIDGDVVNNIQAQPRSIVLDLRIFADVENTKRLIFNIVKLKQKCTLEWEQENNVLDIEGYVESIEMPRWTNATTVQITLHCSQPFWENAEYIVKEISEAIDLHYFTDYPNDMLYFPQSGIPFGALDVMRKKTFYNDGDVAVGLEIEILALETVTNPIITDEDGNYFGVGYGTGAKKVTMVAGDVITINTNKNKKSVIMNGTTSLLNKIKANSTWLQLSTGNNSYAINSDDSSLTNMTFSLKFKQKYI